MTPQIVPVRQIPSARPLQWLVLGWQDFRRAAWPSGFHGLVVATGGVLILALAIQFTALLPGAVSGFVLVGPILATGLYDISRRLAIGQTPRLDHVFAAWRKGTRPLIWLGVLLMIAGTLWVTVSLVLFGLFVKEPIDNLYAFVRYAVQQQGDLLFGLWLLLGALGSALVFAATAVSVPLLLDRETDLRSAILTSVRAVGDNPGAMALWAILIMFATVLSLATAMLGFIFAVPVIGHATWHAYRDLVDSSGLPLRR
ncbi:MAG: DUF2189 domain-containing protein [Burkholderiales bacterium]|nr:DUF2189 domain-containing protein [Burkholderiales bacterium]